jgi:L-alanine-DL-glutamate epimerase-like enolase superfamily enzyme
VQAQRQARAFEPHRLGWIEEPLRADRPAAEWAALAAATSTPLAAGENLLGLDAFDEAVAARRYAVVQPDIAKWGGISGCWPVIARVRAAGLRYCPHYLGAGIGLAASAHLLAAVGGDGLLEVDANPNPLRSALCPHFEDGRGWVCGAGRCAGDRDRGGSGAAWRALSLMPEAALAGPPFFGTVDRQVAGFRPGGRVTFICWPK